MISYSWDSILHIASNFINYNWKEASNNIKLGLHELISISIYSKKQTSLITKIKNVQNGSLIIFGVA
jgi:hypothetical protein